MKLHSLICVGMFAAMGAALGEDVISGTTCAAMAVPATGDYTLVAVPFKDVGGTDAKVKVSDVVKTVGLKAGSCLYYYAGENYYAWKLDADAGTWKGAAITYKKNGKDETTQTPEDDFQVSCGATLWLPLLTYQAPRPPGIVTVLTVNVIRGISVPGTVPLCSYCPQPFPVL